MRKRKLKKLLREARKDVQAEFQLRLLAQAQREDREITIRQLKTEVSRLMAPMAPRKQ